MQLFVISLILCLALLVNLILVEFYGKDLQVMPKSIQEEKPIEGLEPPIKQY